MKRWEEDLVVSAYDITTQNTLWTPTDKDLILLEASDFSNTGYRLRHITIYRDDKQQERVWVNSRVDMKVHTYTFIYDRKEIGRVRANRLREFKERNGEDRRSRPSYES